MSSPLADCSFCMVGQAVGDGMTSDGRLSRRKSFFDSSALIEFEHLMGTMAESSSETSYRSSKSVVHELSLSRSEAEVDASVDAAEEAGEGDLDAAPRGGRSVWS